MNKRANKRMFVKMIISCLLILGLVIPNTSYSKASAIDKTPPTLEVSFAIHNGVATVNVNAQDKDSGIKKLTYISGEVTEFSGGWVSVGVDITGKTSFIVENFGDYSIMAEDHAGNKTVRHINVTDVVEQPPVVIRDKGTEFNGVWISYLELNDRLKDPVTGQLGFTKARFEKMIDEMFDNVVKMKMNAVIVQVRPFSDAMYPSKYFPWSRYISGTQGKNPGFDPMEYMIRAAHARGLEFHAWLNPYRVTSGSTNINLLAPKNQAKKWLTDKNPVTDRFVINHGGSLFYNPASSRVRTLITNGIIEIVENYNVDGIHFDDYFYPALGANHAKLFDSIEYEQYVKQCNDTGKKPMTIANWRRSNINTLLRRVYKAIKDIDETVVFGISPAGNLDNLMRNDAYYCDIKTWLSKPGYMDYIAPQIYWTFRHSKYPFGKTLDRWLALHENKEVKMYVGLATYKAGSNLEPDWQKDKNELKNQILYSRKTGLVDGFMHFRYDFFFRKANQAGVTEMLKIIK